MRQYLDLVKHILEHGDRKEDRTGTGTISVFGYQSKYDLRDGFPLLTTKKVLFSAVVHELLWFLRGSTNINDGLKEFTPIWNAWADENGELGPVYGYQWRKWEKFVYDGKIKGYRKEHIDQIQNAIDMIKNNPPSRRIIVNAWNVADIDRMALPPCHAFFQFYVVGGRLDCQLYQRSADMFLGVPFNIASYALLTMMIAKETGYEVDNNNQYTEEFISSKLNCIGNLMLISGSHNASIGNKPFKEKLSSYIKNPLLNQQAEIKTFASNENEAPVWKTESIEKQVAYYHTPFRLWDGLGIG